MPAGFLYALRCRCQRAFGLTCMQRHQTRQFCISSCPTRRNMEKWWRIANPDNIKGLAGRRAPDLQAVHHTKADRGHRMTNVDTGAAPIWDFVLGYYRQQGVSESAIALQDGAGVDVNMILFLMWLAAQKRVLAAADVKTVSEKSIGWQHNVVMPVRAVRRLLKENAPLVEQEAALAFRKKVQALELEGEQLQLNAMAALSQGLKSSTAASPEAAARDNLAAFQSASGKAFPQSAIDGFAGALKAMTDGK
jgi:uncharacterized protein (TIGR02444 family)